MSCTIENTRVSNMESPLNKFVNYLTSYELRSPNKDEDLILQRLKILASSSGQCVGFRRIDETTYQVFSSHEHIPSNYKLGDIAIDDILPVRSVVFTIDNDTIRVLDYSINRVTNVTNDIFMAKMYIGKSSQEDEETVTVDYLTAHESYEGTVLVARHTSSGWYIRTTSCSANDSYFGSERSHYNMLTSIVPEVKEKLTDLKTQFDRDVYFVFVLVANEQKYLCDYGTSKLILINVRDCETHENLPVQKLADWYDTPVSVASDDVNNCLQLKCNTLFNDTYLGLQGYILTDYDGNLYRTFTQAYQYGCRRMGNHSSLFINALECYLHNSFSTLVALKGISEENAKVLAGHCKVVLNGTRNLFAYMYTLFTTLQVKHNDVASRGHDNELPRSTISKSFLKKNGSLYSEVFDHRLQFTQSFCKLLAMLQKFSLSPKVFRQSSEMANDVEKFIRSLANNDDNMHLLIDVLHNYITFKDHLVDVMKQYNTTQRHQLRVYNYNSEKLFLSVLDNRIQTTKSIDVTTEVVNETIDVVVNKTIDVVVEEQSV